MRNVLVCGACGRLSPASLYQAGDDCPFRDSSLRCDCCGCPGGPTATLAPRPDYEPLGVPGVDYTEAAQLVCAINHYDDCDDGDDQYAALRTALAATVTTDPVAAWIIKHITPDISAAVAVILGMLPTTLHAIDEIALDRGWCRDYAQAVAQAITDGVLRPVTAAVTA